MDSRTVSGIIQRGGTILKSARSDQFRTPEGRAKAADMLDKHGIDSLIVVGGDGSFRGALGLEELGVKVICIPATIDNDIACTDYSIGFDTAVNTSWKPNKIRDTASSHERVYVVEVMGRASGYIALYSGLAGGADVILIPEVPYDLEQVCQQIQKANSMGKTYNIVVVAEGVRPISGKKGDESPSVEIGRYIQNRLVLILGSPSWVTFKVYDCAGSAPGQSLELSAVELVYWERGKMLGEWIRAAKSFDLAYVLAQENSSLIIITFPTYFHLEGMEVEHAQDQNRLYHWTSQ